MGYAHFHRHSFAILLSLVSCIACQHDAAELLLRQHPEVKDDAAYLVSLQQHTKETVVHRDFETIYEIKVTYLSSDFAKKLDKRTEQLFGTGKHDLQVEEDKAAFFVSIFAPDEKDAKLTNRALWSMQLEIAGLTLGPKSIKTLREKRRWQHFFPHVHAWSQEYLVLFETPSLASEVERQQEKRSFRFVMADPHARSELHW